MSNWRLARKGTAAAAAAIAWLLGVAPAVAEDADAELEALLGRTVVSSASRTSEVGDMAPSTTVVITAEDIRRHGVQTLDQAIALLGRGMHFGIPQRGGSDAGARGVMFASDYGNHILLLVDGHVLNEPWAGTSYYDRGAGIPLELVDHIEVMLGPGSVMYGSNAMLAVVNVITKRAKDFQGLHVIAEATARSPLVEGGAFELGAPGDLALGRRLAVGWGQKARVLGVPVETVGEVEWYHQGPGLHRLRLQDYGDDAYTAAPKDFGPRSPPGQWGGDARRNGGMDVPAAYVVLRAGQVRAALRTAYLRRGPVNGFGDFDTAQSYDAERWTSFDLSHEGRIGERLTLSSRLFADEFGYTSRSAYSSLEDCAAATPGCTWNYWGGSRQLRLEEQLTVDWLGDGAQQTTLGVTGALRRVGASSVYLADSGEISPPVVPYEEDERAGALWLQHAYRPTSFAAFSAGLRADADDRASALSPRGAASVSPWGGGTVRLTYAEGFRSPTSYEVNYAFPGYSVSSALDPERARGIELTVEQRVAEERFSLAGFAYEYRDLIAERALTAAELSRAIQDGLLTPDVTDGYRLSNSGSVRTAGGELSGDGRLRRSVSWGAALTAAWKSEKLAAAPDLSGNARVAWELGEKLPTLAVAGALTGSRPIAKPTDSGFVGPDRVGPRVVVRGAITGPVPGVDWLSYRAAVSWATSAPSPYLLGPTNYATTAEPRPHLAPEERLSAMLGLSATLF
ncbi:MAG: TonB-dependent receptor [Deltaproteobacteria bacterium]|nr:TonB-dependent receptor [Deltaproteobacteria bacterium]